MFSVVSCVYAKKQNNKSCNFVNKKLDKVVIFDTILKLDLAYVSVSEITNILFKKNL